MSNVITEVVNHQLCIGCGVCAGVCPGQSLSMGWTTDGQLAPSDQGWCSSACCRCLRVCPFYDNDENEDSLAAACFGRIPGVDRTSEAGYVLCSYVGHAAEGYRERGASGGLTSWMLANLMERGIVDRVACVRPTNNPRELFRYTICSTTHDVQAGAGSAYYPVDVSTIVRTMLSEDHRYAIIGLPCFLKALRLAMRDNTCLKSRVVVLLGLVCGQLKSRGFTDYLVRTLGQNPAAVRKVEYRGKNTDKPATNVMLQVHTNDGVEQIPWSGAYGKTWRRGEFKIRACEFCDDVFAEVADAAFMDAWLPEFQCDGRGTSIVLIRQPWIADIIADGTRKGSIIAQRIATNRVIASQRESLLYRRQMLRERLWLAERDGKSLRKRVSLVRPSFLRRWHIRLRENIRATSHTALRAASAPDSSAVYDTCMASLRRQETVFTAIARRVVRARSFVRRFLGLMRGGRK